MVQVLDKDLGGPHVVPNVTTHTTDPGVTNDLAHGYGVGDECINTSSGAVFKCVDSTNGAAVWSGPGNAAITGGTINNAVIGSTTPAAGTFTNLTATGLTARAQGAPAAKTVSATLTGAELVTGIITVNQGGAAPSALQLPNGTAIQAALPAGFAIGESFDVSLVNISSVAAEVASFTVNTDVTIVGNAAVDAIAAAKCSSGIFRFRKTADHVFVAYRVG